MLDLISFTSEEKVINLTMVVSLPPHGLKWKYVNFSRLITSGA